jgi:outer membrane protein
MKTALSFGLLLLFGSASLTLAQEPAATAPARDGQPRIAVIDIERITAESVMGKDYGQKIDSFNNEIKSEVTKKQAALEKIDGDIAALQQDLQKQGPVLSEEALEAKQQDLRKKERDRDAFVQDSQQELQRKQNSAKREVDRLNAEFQEKIRPQIEAVVRERKIDILLHSGAIAFANPAFDISKDIITKADEAERAKKPAGAKPPDNRRIARRGRTHQVGLPAARGIGRRHESSH